MKILLKGIILCSIGVLGFITIAEASLTQSEFKQYVNAYYDLLEKQQSEIGQALDRRENTSIIISKSCAYVGTLKRFENYALKNRHLTAAQEEAAFIKELRLSFEPSFKDFGTSSHKACKA